jgi:hypothetical protein
MLATPGRSGTGQRNLSTWPSALIDSMSFPGDLPPRSPKLNGCVERAHRTHTEEFYQVEDFPLDMAGLNQALRAWEHTYNTIRPHQALATLPRNSICYNAERAIP